MQRGLLIIGVLLAVSCNEAKDNTSEGDSTLSSADSTEYDTMPDMYRGPQIEGYVDIEVRDTLSAKPPDGRIPETDPCLGSNEVKSLYDIEAAPIRRMWDTTQTIPPTRYARIPDANIRKFSPDQLFIYCTQYPEEFSQVCAMPIEMDHPESTLYERRLFMAELEQFSRRQDSLLALDRKGTLDRISQCIRSTSVMSTRFRRVFLQLEAVELISDVIWLYEQSKEPDLLTLLVNLMNDADFKPYQSSELKARFRPDEDWRFMYQPLTTDVEREVISLAQKMLRS